MGEDVEEAGGGGGDFVGELDEGVVAVGRGGGRGGRCGGGAAGAEGLAPPGRAAGRGGEFLGPDYLNAAGGSGESGDLARRNCIIQLLQERFCEGVFGGVEGFLLLYRRLVFFRGRLAWTSRGSDTFVVFVYGE